MNREKLIYFKALFHNYVPTFLYQSNQNLTISRLYYSKMSKQTNLCPSYCTAFRKKHTRTILWQKCRFFSTKVIFITNLFIIVFVQTCDNARWMYYVCVDICKYTSSTNVLILYWSVWQYAGLSWTNSIRSLSLSVKEGTLLNIENWIQRV